ncbi:MAG: NAD(P)H-hydrate dehydratase [Acidimicrobiia bacterium]
MLPVLTPEEMGAADAATIAAGTPQKALMGRAGRAVARTALDMLGGGYGHRCVVAAGKGNNGGDGLIAAEALRRRGVGVEVVRLDDGVGTVALDRALSRADLVIDAMYGTGFRGSLEGDAAVVADRLRDGPPVLAVDIPSGVDGLTGAAAGPTVQATATVCFAALKPGVVFDPGATASGDIDLVDIGIDVSATTVGVTEISDVAAWLPALPVDNNKWRSPVSVVGGSGGMTGAPAFVSHAAMRAGAGIVWCNLPGREAARAASGSEVITRAVGATPEGDLESAGAREVLESLPRFRALALGPGLGRSGATATAVRHILDNADLPVVLDADGLNALAGDPGLLTTRSHPTVLTPHDGEFERLTGHPVGADRVAAARDLAVRADSVVLLKGSTTVVAEPPGRAALNITGGPWLGTAGTGDVLTGIVAAFLARGVPAFEAATAGAFVHGLAADVAGHPGLIAGDLIDALGPTLAQVGTTD